ncbi:MAG: putative alpha/beta superfamily hydrolase, partial [Maribacter sp.]
NFWVKLPENYNPDSNEKYAVIYLLDGFSLKNTLETVYDNYWGHYLPHMILVGVSNRTNRTRDLTTSQIKMRRGSTMDVETGGAETFTKYMEEELIPYIDSKYPTMPYRTLIGHSYAGLFTINILINHSHLFENYIAIDPSLDWDNQKLLKQAKEKLTTSSFKGKSLFVSLAAEMLDIQNEKITIDNIKEDSSEYTLFARSIIDFSDYAATHSQNGLNFSWKVYPEDLHGTVPLPSIRDGLIYLFKWYQFKSPQKYNNSNTSVEELVELLKNQEEIYSKHFGYTTPPMIEEMLSGYGYMNMQMEQPEKAFMFFKMNIKYNPLSAAAHESIADYYESQNDVTNALKSISKAFELSGAGYYQNKMKELEAKK